MDSWPNVGTVGLSVVVSIATAIRGRVGGDVEHVLTWTHALATDEAPGRLRPRELVVEQLQLARETVPTSLPDLAERYSAAAGSSELGLAALAAGLTVAQTTTGATRGTLDADQLRRTAAARGIELP